MKKAADDGVDVAMTTGDVIQSINSIAKSLMVQNNEVMALQKCYVVQSELPLHQAKAETIPFEAFVCKINFNDKSIKKLF